MVIGLATDVGVGSERSGGGFVQLHLIELGVQNILDPFVGTDTGGKSTSAGRFETLVRVAFAEVEDAHAGSVGLLGVSSGGEGDSLLDDPWAGMLARGQAKLGIQGTEVSPVDISHLPAFQPDPSEASE